MDLQLHTFSAHVFTLNSGATRSASRVRRNGFTLVEVLVAMGLLALLSLVIVSIVSGISTAWLATQSRVETFRNGRAVLNFMERDFSALVLPQNIQTGISSVLPRSQALPSQRVDFQFVQDAGDPANGITPLLSNGWVQVPYSSNWFGQARLKNTSQGDIWIIGYYLARSADGNRYELRRYLVPPNDMAGGGGANPDFKLFASDPSYTCQQANGYSASPRSPQWLYLDSAAFEKYSSSLSDNVIAFWVRCIDRAGKPIPWLMSRDASATPFKFNSAARFLFKAPDETPSFQYLQSSALPANRLPIAVELTLITVDSRVFLTKRIPDADAPSSAEDIPVIAKAYEKKLIDAGIKSARTFSILCKLEDPL